MWYLFPLFTLLLVINSSDAINVYYLEHSHGKEMGIELGKVFKDIWPSYAAVFIFFPHLSFSHCKGRCGIQYSFNTLRN